MSKEKVTEINEAVENVEEFIDDVQEEVETNKDGFFKRNKNKLIVGGAFIGGIIFKTAVDVIRGKFTSSDVSIDIPDVVE